MDKLLLMIIIITTTIIKGELKGQRSQLRAFFREDTVQPENFVEIF